MAPTTSSKSSPEMTRTCGVWWMSPSVRCQAWTRHGGLPPSAWKKSRTGSNLRRMVYFSTIDESMVLGASSLLILKDEMIIQTNA